MPVHALRAISETSSLNVLFIAIDDLNDWTGGLGGHPNALTPNIDTLGDSGVLFTNAHAQAPICGPSRASFMTGLYPTTTGIYLHIDDRDVRDANEATRTVIFLPQYFENHGYKTMGVGKIWHDNDLANTFQKYGERHDWFGPIPDKRINYDPSKGPHYDGQAGTGTDWGTFPENDKEMPDYYYASWAIERLQEAHDRPFFLGVGFVRPHVPWYVPQHWMDKHPLNKIELPPYKEDDMDDIPELARKITFMPPMPTTNYLIERGQWHEMVQAYLASSTWVDYQVGRVLRALQESAYAKNTIVVLFSDHGYHLGEKNRVAKMSLWERDTRVPLIFAGPSIPQGIKSDRPVGLIDLYPTLLALTGLPTYERNEGRNLTPLMMNPKLEWPYPAITSFGPRNIALRDDRFRYIRYEDGSEELYDHENDPHEWYNLAKNPQKRAENEHVINRLKRLIPTAPAPLAERSTFTMNAYFRERMVRGFD
jgi:arylsulfatase A-like enzyme